MSIPWVEKYRPRTLKDIVGNAMMIQRFMEFAKVGNVPNLIISGPPGCGKTTSVWALARDMLGAQVKDACLELNASDERGIDVVRERIKQFASRKVTLPPGRHKIVILDEADSMTEGAQQALRRIMEIHSGTTRFAFACNQSDKIIEPLQSRCAIVKYGKPDGLEAILFTAQGDMRQALNNLQCTVAGYGKITKEAVFKVCDEPHPEKLREMFELCVHDDLMTSMFKLVKVVDVPEALRLEFIMEIGKCHALVVQGLTTRVQLAGLVARLCHAHQKLADS
ncbi:ATPase family associated with various cellular activities (AAA) domain-containing protein [Ditylenchus destructor]|uniref:Replication factor C subunit 2 n=1 Tax=Ditylenchus destructor TaxID=166010 RepID=A0AAD4RBJ2_9BILA|nr:ATPase family associated with various cellular activities (AAA) domain-containing protein [Ditylenchus destructor]